MANSPDVVIFGAGIAGLWLFHHLKKIGYDVLLFERDAIGCGQTIAAQGIIHSGLKFTLAGKVSSLARSISAMPQLWREALDGQGPVDLSTAHVNAPSQFLMIPSGFIGDLTTVITKKALGGKTHSITKENWPDGIVQNGFKGSLVYMDEPVLDVPSVLMALSAPYHDQIYKISDTQASDPITFLKELEITPKKVIFTGAASNMSLAKHYNDHHGLETQMRPLHQGLMKGAPFPLYAHFVGKTDKPIATITTHTAKDGSLIWYFGAGVAERAKESDPRQVIEAAKSALKSYLPAFDFSNAQWATWPVDRVEGKSKTENWMPDTPTIHSVDNRLYCWPTKMTFAPLLTSMILDHFEKNKITPSRHKTHIEDLPLATFAKPPWERVTWTS